MKIKTNGMRLSLAAAAILALAVMCRPAIGQTAKTPPKPKEPISVLKPPPGATSEKVAGRASLPAGMKVGFAVDVAESLLAGDWNLTAQVSSVKDQEIEFVTDKNQVGRLAFRLPAGMRLVAEPKQKLTISRTVAPFDLSLERRTMISVGEKNAVAEGRLFGRDPVKREIFAGAALEQNADSAVKVGESTYQTDYMVPVSVIVDGKRTQLKVGTPQDISVGRASCRLLIRESARTVPVKGQEGTVEGIGFALEYLVVFK
jgi:hypothetical protein